MSPRDILITGGSDGIGLAIARLLAVETDTRVTLVAREAAKLRKAIGTLSGAHHQAITADLSASNGIEAVARLLESKHYDILINNAGFGLYGTFTDLPLDDQLRMMRLNMESVMVLSHAYLRKATRGDTLVNTASFLAYAPLPGAAVYSATKAFVAALSETLWWEYRRKGVYVMAFAPGVVATRFHSSAGGSMDRFPGVLVQSAERAAMELVVGLRKRTAPRVITGFPTRMLVRLLGLVTRKTAINMISKSSPIRDSPSPKQ